jgi:predicted dehydrogenase
MSDEVVEVHSFGSVLSCPEMAEIRDVDSAVVNLRFKRGGIGNAECHRKSNYGYDIRTEIIGSKGAIQIGYLQQTAQFLLTSVGASHDIVDHWTVRFADAYRNEVQDFVDCVLAGKPTRVTAQDALHALAISTAAERSYRESRPVALAAK